MNIIIHFQQAGLIFRSRKECILLYISIERRRHSWSTARSYNFIQFFMFIVLKIIGMHRIVNNPSRTSDWTLQVPIVAGLPVPYGFDDLEFWSCPVPYENAYAKQTFSRTSRAETVLAPSSWSRGENQANRSCLVPVTLFWNELSWSTLGGRSTLTTVGVLQLRLTMHDAWQTYLKSGAPLVTRHTPSSESMEWTLLIPNQQSYQIRYLL